MKNLNLLKVKITNRELESEILCVAKLLACSDTLIASIVLYKMFCKDIKGHLRYLF